MSLDIHMFVGPVSVDIASEVDVRAVELLERLRHFHGKPNDLVRDQLPLQRSPRLGTVVHDAGRITPIKAVGRAVVAGVGIVKDVDRQAALQGTGSGHRGHIGEVLMFDRL